MAANLKCAHPVIDLLCTMIFLVPLALETVGTISVSTGKFVKELASRLQAVTGYQREGEFLINS